jgi:hypothetical protein
LDLEHIKKQSGSRNITICEICLTKARTETDIVFKLSCDLLSKLEALDSCDQGLLRQLELIFVKISTFLNINFSKECLIEATSVKTHKVLKSESKCIDFLCAENRSRVILNSMLGLSGQPLIGEKSELSNMATNKMKSLCLAYESLMGVTNSNLTTAPSVLINLKLLKATHSKAVLAECGLPTGGSYVLLQNLATSKLPELNPPESGDFVSADDNIQVILLSQPNSSSG